MILPAKQQMANHSLETIPRQETFFDILTPLEAGMMVLTSSMQVLHMNSQARTLMAHFGIGCELWPHLPPESMPAIVTEFCSHVLSELRRKTGSNDWTALEMRRICHMVSPALLFRGFAVPEIDGREPRMILILQICHS